MEQEIQKTETKIKKWNWKVFVLSVVVYYVVEIALSFLLLILSSNMDRVYKILVALVGALYFYQTRKEKVELKKDVVWVSVAGVITVILLVLSYL